MSIYQFDAKLLNSPTVTEQLSGGRLAGKSVDLEFSNADGTFTTDRDSGDLAIGNMVRLDHYLPDDAPALRTYLYGKITSIDIPGEVATITVEVEDPDAFSQQWPSKVYETDDWNLASNGAPYDTNSSTKINPTQDLGRVYPVGFGRCRKVRAVYVYADYDNDQYYYIFNRGTVEATNSDKGTKINVYRDDRLVDTDEYTVYDGSQVSPFAGYAYVVFAREQSNGSALYEITVDYYGTEMSESTAPRNPATILEWILSDSTVGIGHQVNELSFAEAATTLSTLDTDKSIYIDGGIDEQITLQDMIDHLAEECGRSYIYKNTDDEWCIATDTYQSTSQATFGYGDNNYRNILSLNSYKHIDLVKTVTVKYAKDNWTGEFKHSLSRSVMSDGEELVYEFPLIYDHQSADLICCYMQRRLLYGNYEVQLELGMEARDLEIYKPITVVQKWLSPTDRSEVTNINGDFQIREIERGLYQWKVTAYTNDSDIYTYSAATLPTDPDDDTITDYSFTQPSAPTGLAIETSGSRQGADGTTYAYYRLSCTPPAVNCQHIEFGYKQKNATNYQWVTGTDSSGTWYGMFEAIIPRQYYYFAARAINNNNAAGFTQGALAEITNGGSGYTAPGDTTAPGTITSGTATVKFKTWRFPWTKSSAADIKDYHVQISTGSGFPSTVYDGYVGADYKEFTYDAAAYGTTLYARVKGRDHTGNESASWSSTMSATCSQISETDIGTGAVTYGKIKVSTLSAISANVGTLTAGVIQSGSYTSGVKIDLNNGYIQIKDASDPCLLIIDSTNNVRTFLWAGNSFGSIGVYGYTSALLKFGVSSGGSTWGYYADRMVLSSAALYPETDNGLNLGKTTNTWGSLYLDAGSYYWRLWHTTSTWTGLWFNYNGSGQAIIDTGGNIYANGSINQNAWSLDMEKYDRWDLFDKGLEAYRAHDGSKLHKDMQKVNYVVNVKQDKHGKDIEETAPEPSYAMPIGDLIQVLYECVHSLRKDVEELKNAA